jgi:hypothetical protein
VQWGTRTVGCWLHFALELLLQSVSRHHEGASVSRDTSRRKLSKPELRPCRQQKCRSRAARLWLDHPRPLRQQGSRISLQVVSGLSRRQPSASSDSVLVIDVATRVNCSPLQKAKRCCLLDRRGTTALAHCVVMKEPSEMVMRFLFCLSAHSGNWNMCFFGHAADSQINCGCG